MFEVFLYILAGVFREYINNISMPIINVVSMAISTENAKAVAALFAFILFFVEAFAFDHYIFQPFIKRLKGEDKESKSKMSPHLLNELRYAEYLKWAAINGYDPYLKKVEILAPIY